mgnify:CR=1 FL=1
MGLETLIPALLSRAGSSAAGLTLRQAPRAVVSSGGFNPLVQIPAALSKSGSSSAGLTLQQVPRLAGGVTSSVRNAAANPLNQLTSGAAGLASLSPLAGVMLQSGIRSVNTLIDPQTGLVPTATRLVRGVGNLAQGRPYESRWGTIPPRTSTGESYRDAELRLSAAARAAGGPSAGGGLGGGNAASSLDQLAPSPASPPPGGGPAERAYREEVSRTAQLAAQNPELTRYQADAAEAVKSGDQARMDAVRDRGMEMWAKANPKLAAKVKPGQSGYDAIQRTLNAGTMGSPMNFPFDSSNLLASAPAAPAPSYQGATPSPLTGVGSLPTNAFAGATATPYSNMLQGQTLQSAPLAVPSVQPTASYEGAQNLQGIGAPLTSDQFATDKARQLRDMYLKATLGT